MVHKRKAKIIAAARSKTEAKMQSDEETEQSAALSALEGLK
jgi:hypothetical protein